MSENKTRTITLTGRPPVKISEQNWPLIASASDRDWDNEFEFQSNRRSRWFVGVRQHEDGRALVYAIYSYDSNWQGERDLSARRGVLIESGADIASEIEHVCADIARTEHYGEDAGRWQTLAADCVASLPAEELG